MPKPKPRRQARPTKPYPDFPLFPHATGQWAKKIRGKLYYFGKDPQVALDKYVKQRDDLQAGRAPRPENGGLNVRELCNRFLTSKKLLLNAGELSPRTWRDYYDCCETIVKAFGKTCTVADLVGNDFEKLRASLATRRGPVALGNQVQRVRTVFKYAFDEVLIDRPVRFGTTFRRPSRKAIRKARQAAGVKIIEAEELRRILDAAKQPLRAMILLGLNCGFGQSDVANLPRQAIDLDRGWIDFPRPKTAVQRRCPLWPETVSALRKALTDRPESKDPADEPLVFITSHGRKWVRTREREVGGAVTFDAIGWEFRKLLESLGLKRNGSFYNLRHTFRTVADATKDQPAIDFIMGHTSESMSSHYRERIDDDRLRAIADVVRNWLWPVETVS
jgi:integrase